MRYRRPIERLFYHLGFHGRELTEEELAAVQADWDAQDAMLEQLLKEQAERDGEKYIALNEQLQNDPDAAVPPELEAKALELIDKYMG